MIIKSLSRKAPTFRQLKAYMDREGAPGMGFAWNMEMPWFAPDEDVIKAFADNAAKLRERRGGVRLYHEIVSLKRDDRLPLEVQQRILHDATLEWLKHRAPDQMAYGRLHVEREHIHVHVMLSANRLGDERPVRLSRAEFAAIQRQVEARVLDRYPQLRQERSYDAPKRAERSFRHARPDGPAEGPDAFPDGRAMDGSAPHTQGQVGSGSGQEPDPIRSAAADAASDRDHVAAVLRDALARAPDGRSCLDALRACGVATHRRGSTVSFEYRERRFRLLSLGLPYEEAARFHRYLALPPPAPSRVARDSRKDVREKPAGVARAGMRTGKPGYPAPKTAPAPGRRTAGADTCATKSADQAWLAFMERHGEAFARELWKLLERGVFGDTRAAYWSELVRAYRDGRKAGGKPGVPPRRDLPGTRRMSLALRRILGALQDEPAAVARDVRRLMRDFLVGPGEDQFPSLEELARQVEFRSTGPWRKRPSDRVRKPDATPVPPPADPAKASEVPAPTSAPGPAQDVPPNAPAGDDANGTRKNPSALGNIMEALRNEPAAATREVRSLLYDVLFGPSRGTPPAPTRVPDAGPATAPQAALEPGTAPDSPIPPTPPAPPTVPAPERQDQAPVAPAAQPDPRWEKERQRIEAVRMALLRNYVRRQEREREWARKRKRDHGRDDPGRGG